VTLNVCNALSVRRSCAFVVTAEWQPAFSFESANFTKISPDLKASKPIDDTSTLGITRARQSDFGMPDDDTQNLFYFSELGKGRSRQKCLSKAKVPLTSANGRRIFGEALASGSAESYFFLAEQFRTQNELPSSGMTALVMVLNSLRIDPMRTWKGAWRWFTEENMGCLGCEASGNISEHGLTFDMFKHMASCNGANVGVHRAPSVLEGPKEQFDFANLFRSMVKSTSCKAEREFLVVGCSCASLGLEGADHFLVISGYHEDSDSALVMDVARMKSPVYWIPIAEIVQAMSYTDFGAQKPSGFMWLGAHPLPKADPMNSKRPLNVPQVPKAAGRQLSYALTRTLSKKKKLISGLESRLTATLSDEAGRSTWGASAMCRWLRAASLSEPQVLRRLLQVGDKIALQEMIGRFQNFPLYRDLRAAYASLFELGLSEDFPPLQFTEGGAPLLNETELSLHTCGEFWVLLLLLAPQHIRAAVAEELACPQLSSDFVKSVRGPWALPLEVSREALGEIFQHSLPQRCA